jgi:hypothetical protein
MKDKILSLLNRVKESVVSLFNRFPVATVLIVIQAVALSLVVELNYFDIHPKQEYFLVIGVVATYSVIFHSILIQLLTERFGWSLKKNLLLNLGALILTDILCIVFLYNDFMAYDTLTGTFTAGIYRVLVYVALSGLLLLIVPFLKDKDNKTWWNFTLFSANKFAVSLLYSIVLYAGISIALAALESFWSITLFEHQYELLPIITFILFAPLNFLSDVFDFNFKGEIVLPKFLSIFGKYILTPLIVIYTAILYPYMFSFPFKQEWPSNQATFIIVAMLAMIYAVMYIFWQTKEGDKDFKFINLFVKIANAISIPTVAFWAYSLWLRIDEYKLTVNRFMLMAIILWFMFNSIYFVFAKVRDIRVVLSAFVLVIALSFYMPFTSFYFGQRAQVARLNQIATDQGIVKEGKIVKGNKEKTADSEVQMKDILVYLNQFHGLNQVTPILSDEILKKVDVDGYGYSALFLNRYSQSDNVFFAELLPASNGFQEMGFKSISLDYNIYSSIPEGVTQFVLVEGYPSENVKVNGTKFTYNDITFDITLNLEDERFFTNMNYNVDKSTMPYGPDTLITKDANLLTFKSGEYVLVIRNINTSVKDGKIVDIQYLNGILFKR